MQNPDARIGSHACPSHARNLPMPKVSRFLGAGRSDYFALSGVNGLFPAESGKNLQGIRFFILSAQPSNHLIFLKTFLYSCHPT